MLVSGNVFHIVSALQSIVCLYIFSADQTSYRSYVGSAYRLRSLAVSCFSYHAKPICYVCNCRLFSLSSEIEMAEKQKRLGLSHFKNMSGQKPDKAVYVFHVCIFS